MTRFFIAFLACIGTGFLAGCSASIRAPKAFFDRVNSAENQGKEVVAAFNSAVMHAPGLTLSVSGSYLPPIADSDGAAPSRITDYTFAYANEPTFSLHVRGPESCFPAVTLEGQLGEALQSTLAGVKGLPAEGSVTVELAAAGPGIRRYAFSMRRGRFFALKYFVSCRPDDQGQALIYAAMLGLHEATHASLALRKLQSKDPQHRESVAIGGEACLFLALADRGVLVQLSHQTLRDRLIEAASGASGISTSQQCALWRATILRSHSH